MKPKRAPSNTPKRPITSRPCFQSRELPGRIRKDVLDDMFERWQTLKRKAPNQSPSS